MTEVKCRTSDCFNFVTEKKITIYNFYCLECLIKKFLQITKLSNKQIYKKIVNLESLNNYTCKRHRYAYIENNTSLYWATLKMKWDDNICKGKQQCILSRSTNLEDLISCPQCLFYIIKINYETDPFLLFTLEYNNLDEFMKNENTFNIFQDIYPLRQEKHLNLRKVVIPIKNVNIDLLLQDTNFNHLIVEKFKKIYHSNNIDFHLIIIQNINPKTSKTNLKNCLQNNSETIFEKKFDYAASFKYFKEHFKFDKYYFSYVVNYNDQSIILKKVKTEYNSYGLNNIYRLYDFKSIISHLNKYILLHKPTYAIKFDIKNAYNSFNYDTFFDLLSKDGNIEYFKKSTFLEREELIFNDKRLHVSNYSHEVFRLYLCLILKHLDFIKKGGIFIYCDDFIIFGDNLSELRNKQNIIHNELKQYNLNIHKIQEVNLNNNGLYFLNQMLVKKPTIKEKFNLNINLDSQKVIIGCNIVLMSLIMYSYFKK